ncbi:hypothetical protein C4J92_1371 [Pseudomonas sp. R3-18-08]|nr:hypothetical protein C4J92_1371 [Pseudomonas sp. R3-18-08]
MPMLLDSGTAKNVGGGLLPMAVYQSGIIKLTHRYREQAPSHI